MLLDDLYQVIEKLRERKENHQDKLGGRFADYALLNFLEVAGP